MISTLLLLVATAAVGVPPSGGSSAVEQRRPPEGRTATPDVAVVCPQPLRAEMAPWVEYRTRQGHQVAWVDATGSDRAIRGRLQALNQDGSLKYVVLVGDAPATNAQVTFASDLTTSTHLAAAKVNLSWGSEPEIASDHYFANLSGDSLPEVAIGRLPADSPADLRRMVQKIIAYETSTNFGAWRRRVNFIAGLGGFGPLADAALEGAAKKLITDGLPPGYATSMTYGSWRSPYCPDPRSFRDATLGRLNEGCLFWVYIGHGHRRTVDWVHVPGGDFPIFSDRDLPHLRSTGGFPIACFLACYAGAFDHEHDCLAEEMMRAPGGPIAVYAGSRVTMPYGMSVMGMALLETCFGDTCPATLGEAIRETKCKMMAKDSTNPMRRGLDGLAALISPAPADLAAERAEHLDLFNLMGDPLLRLPRPQTVALHLATAATPGKTLTIEGTTEVNGVATVELVVRRDRLTFEPTPRAKFEPTAAFLLGLNKVYNQANDPRLATVKQRVENGRFSTTLEVPEGAEGPCHVRAFIEGDNSYAVGACDFELTSPAATTPSGIVPSGDQPQPE